MLYFATELILFYDQISDLTPSSPYTQQFESWPFSNILSKFIHSLFYREI